MSEVNSLTLYANLVDTTLGYLHTNRVLFFWCKKHHFCTLSHQKLNATFWLVETKEVPVQKGQLKVTINEVEDYPLPQLLIRYINASSLFGAD